MAGTKNSPYSKSQRYKCPTCSRTFRRVEHLRRHETSHTGTRPHVCPKCNATFFRGDVLVRHMRNVHKTMISGVKELRSTSQIYVDSRDPPYANAAGTSASMDVPHHNPNPNPVDSAQASGRPLSPPGGVYSQNWLNYSYNQSNQLLNPQYSSLNYSGAPQPSPPLVGSLPSAHGHSHQHFSPYLHYDSSVLGPTHPILGQPNPPIQNLIAYGYGPYTASVPGWTDPALMLQSVPSPTPPHDEHVKIRGGTFLEPYEKIKRRSSFNSEGTEQSSGSSILLDRIPKVASRNSVWNSIHDERAQYRDFIPTCYASSSGSEDTPCYSDLYTSSSEADSLGKSSGESLVSSASLVESHITSIPRRKTEMQQQRPPPPSPLHVHTPMALPSAIPSAIDSKNPSHERAHSSEKYSGLYCETVSVDAEWSKNASASGFRESSETMPDVCPACDLPYKSLKGTTHDFSFKLIGSNVDFSKVLNLFVGTSTVAAPSVLQLDRYLSYFSRFCHPTMPIIHQPSFDPHTARPALLFVICSLGANMMQEHNMAQLLQYNADRLLAQDWNNFLRTNSTEMDIEQWLYFMQTSIFIEWQSMAITSSPRLINVAYIMRDLQSRLLPYLPTIYFHINDPAVSKKQWIIEQQVLRCFAKILTHEYIFVCCYSHESRSDKILDACKTFPVPCSELLWNTSFESEDSWRVHLRHELMTNQASKNPQTFGDLLLSLQNFNVEKLKRQAKEWRLTPAASLVFVTFACVQCETRASSLDKNSDLFELLRAKARSPTPFVGQCAILCSVEEPADRASSPLASQCIIESELSPVWERFWQNQHPLSALASIVVESSRVGRFINDLEIKKGLSRHDSDLISKALLEQMIKSQKRDMSHLLPVVGFIMDFVRCGLVMGPRMGFNMMYTLSLIRIVGALLSYRTLSFFCCWVFAAELKARTGQKLDEQNARVLSYVYKSCLEYSVPGVTPLPEFDVNEPVAMGGSTIPSNGKGISRPVRLTIAVGIIKLLGYYVEDLPEKIPAQPFYKALLNIGSYLDSTPIAPL